MTFSKKCRILNEEIAKHGENFVIIEILDKYAFEVGKTDVTRITKVRDVITLKDVSISFEMKEGGLYEVYSITQQFNDLIKSINKQNFSPMRTSHEFEDTKAAFMEEWQKFHPGEDYKKYRRKQFNHMMHFINNAYADVFGRYYDIRKRVFA